MVLYALGLDYNSEFRLILKNNAKLSAPVAGHLYAVDVFGSSNVFGKS